jgi:hypothetical protein
MIQPMVRSRPLATLAICALATLVACGDDDPEPGAGPDTPTATTIPSPPGGATIPDLPDNRDPSRIRCTAPPRGTFDATAVVGGPLEEAEAEAEARGCSVREVRRDGEDLAATQDFRPDRANVATREGDVVRILSIG